MDDRNLEDSTRPEEPGIDIKPVPQDNGETDNRQQDKERNPEYDQQQNREYSPEYGQGQSPEHGQRQNQNYSYGYYQTGQGENQQYNNMYRPQPPVNNNSFALVALVIGIVSILFACCTGIGGIALGALGIIFAVISRGKMPMCTQAKVGLGISIAGIVLGIIVFVGSIFLLGSDEFQRMFEDEMHRYGYEYNYDDFDDYDHYRDNFDDGGQLRNGLDNNL